MAAPVDLGYENDDSRHTHKYRERRQLSARHGSDFWEGHAPTISG